MKGYLAAPEATAEAFTADGWLRTGDLGRIDRRGFLFITGRRKNLIITEGGKNVYPEEIENRFQLFDEVEQVMVCGYELDKATRSEGIEARLYPSQALLPTEGSDGGTGAATAAWKDIEARMREIVDEVNQKLLPYQRITKLTVLREPMEMTTTKKVKRFAVKPN